MENRIKYVRVFAQNQEVCTAFRALMTSYMEELDAHSDEPLPMEHLPKWIDSIIAMQGPSDRHTELCYVGDDLIGFLYGKVDHEDHKGFIKPGYGYIMEFYVCPQYRRNGYGKKMFLHMEHLFRKDGAKRMYLTADPVSGKPFWEAMGFANTGEQSPENKLDIYEKDVFYPAFENGELHPLSQETVAEISEWEYEAPYEAYSFKGHHDEYLLDETIWGVEQFCMTCQGKLLGQVACQYVDDDLWVGWSMAPEFTGQGNGATFVECCVQEIRRVKGHTGRILLRVSARNQRAIRAYQKAGFRYVETIQDEIAFSDLLEDFWVMEL